MEDVQCTYTILSEPSETKTQKLLAMTGKKREKSIWMKPWLANWWQKIDLEKSLVNYDSENLTKIREYLRMNS